MTTTHPDEFAPFIRTLQVTGIPHKVCFDRLPKDPWQEILDQGGFNITTLACFVVQVGDEQFVFTKGQAIWTVNPEDPENADQHQGHGPRGAFILRRNAETGAVEYRQHREVRGARALARQYGVEEVLDTPGFNYRG